MQAATDAAALARAAAKTYRGLISGVAPSDMRPLAAQLEEAAVAAQRSQPRNLASIAAGHWQALDDREEIPTGAEVEAAQVATLAALEAVLRAAHADARAALDHALTSQLAREINEGI